MRVATSGEDRWFYGVDVGGTNIKLGVVDDTGTIRAQDVIPTEEPSGPASAVERIADALPRLLEQAGPGNHSSAIVAAGLATPGTMDIPTGKILD
ncbi:MAG: ROK family protein, partial [Planctomycetota bacterium]